MEFITEHPWRQAILIRLEEDDEKKAIRSDNQEWEYIESESIKIGTISHDSVNVLQIQEKIIKLLSTETKDFRLLVHLLNTLQRSGKPVQLILAIALFADYLETFWAIAYPQKMKMRLVQMIIQRFQMAKNDFNEHSIEEERNEATYHLLRLKQFWQEYQPELGEEFDKLIVSYTKSTVITPLVESSSSEAEAVSNHLIHNETVPHQATQRTPASNRPEVLLDQSSDRAWRNTLLKIAEIEASRSFAASISFQLRRHAVWFTIESSPVGDNQGYTMVPPIPLEKLNEYKRESTKPSLELWKKVEGTLSYSPYWFDGHYLSAEIATLLDYPVTAKCIKNELLYFLSHFPDCSKLHFSDGTPFISEQTERWLTQEPGNYADHQDYHEALTIYEEQGLQAAMNFLEQLSTSDLRKQFNAQLIIIQLLNQAKCTNLAKLQLETLQAKASQLSAQEWESSFFQRCQELAIEIGKKEL